MTVTEYGGKAQDALPLLVTDDRCRLQSRELLEPNTPYNGEQDGSGRIVLVKLVSDPSSKARLVRREKRTLLVSDRELTNADVQKVMAEFP